MPCILIFRWEASADLYPHPVSIRRSHALYFPHDHLFRICFTLYLFFRLVRARCIPSVKIVPVLVDMMKDYLEGLGVSPLTPSDPFNAAAKEEFSDTGWKCIIIKGISQLQFTCLGVP